MTERKPDYVSRRDVGNAIFRDSLRPGDIFLLDWNACELLGWERGQSDLMVDSIIRGIEAGDKFSPVSVYRCGHRSFVLSPHLEPGKLAEGGHHRAMGHYIAGMPLRCRLVSNKLEEEYPLKLSFPISGSTIVDDEGEYGFAKRMFPNYR